MPRDWAERLVSITYPKYGFPGLSKHLTELREGRRLMATNSQAFSITASDPDGHSLNYTWRLNGEIVSTASSYTFQSELSDAGESFGIFLSVDENGRR